MRDVLVLCYHAVSDRWASPLAVTSAALERQLQLLVERGYQATTFTEAVLDPPFRRTLAVTFDDAYASVERLGRPVLDRLGLRATVFAPTAWVDRGGPMAWDGIARWADGDHRQELVPMDWGGLRGLADAGWEVGSHTVTHPRLTELPPEALRRELTTSRAACEDRLGRPCTSIAYPYGAVDARVRGAARAAGYSAGATLPSRRVPAPQPLGWPRVGVYPGESERRFRRSVSPMGRRLARTPAGPALERAAGVAVRLKRARLG